MSFNKLNILALLPYHVMRIEGSEKGDLKKELDAPRTRFLLVVTIWQFMLEDSETKKRVQFVNRNVYLLDRSKQRKMM